MTQAAAHAQTQAEIDDEARPKTPLELVVEDMKDLGSVAFRTFYYTARGKLDRPTAVQQCYAIGNESVFFMVVTMAFIGAIVGFQMGLQTRRIIPDMTLVGAMYLKLLIRELAPSVGAFPLATRVGAGIAAQIGSMVVTDQIDAMRMSGADPIEFIVVPRFVACIVMGLFILVIGGIVAFGSGMVVTNILYDVNYQTFINASQVTWGDCVAGFVKCIAYGGIIAIVSAQRGLRTFGGSEGVGKATTEAVVGSLFGINLMQLLIGAIAHKLLPA